MFASLEDINTHLPNDKLVLNEGTVTPFSNDADNVIRAYLSGVYTPLTLAGWDAPDNTPQTVRSIAGRLIAAKYYRERFATDSDVDPAFAQNLYNEAMGMLMGVKGGSIILPEVTTDTDDQFNRNDFYPNDDAGDPMFSIGMEFG